MSSCFLVIIIKFNYRSYQNNIIVSVILQYEEKGAGYSPAYVRDDLSDDLHETFGFRTDYEIINFENFEKIFKQLKRKNKYAEKSKLTIAYK